MAARPSVADRAGLKMCGLISRRETNRIPRERSSSLDTEMVLFEVGINRKTRLLSENEVCSFPDSFHLGEVSEWFKERAWKARVRVTVPGVRIPPSPPLSWERNKSSERSSVVELHLAKVNVESSNLFARSILNPFRFRSGFFFWLFRETFCGSVGVPCRSEACRKSA